MSAATPSKRYPSQLNSRTVRLSPEVHRALKRLRFSPDERLSNVVRRLLEDCDVPMPRRP